MKIMEGDRVKHKFTGQLYELKTIQGGTYILESDDTPYRMWFGEGDLELFFEIAEKRKIPFKKTKGGSNPVTKNHKNCQFDRPLKTKPL